MVAKRVWSRLSGLVLLTVTGCASVPTGPTVLVLPAPGKPFEAFQADDIACRQWASSQVGTSPGEAASQSTASGAALGTVIGSGIGAALGAAAGNAGAGAAIGGGSGLLVGTASGANAGEYGSNQIQRRYDNAFVQCMYAKGNQVPGVVRRSKRTRKNLPPPPSAEYESAPVSPPPD